MIIIWQSSFSHRKWKYRNISFFFSHQYHAALADYFIPCLYWLIGATGFSCVKLSFECLFFFLSVSQENKYIRHKYLFEWSDYVKWLSGYTWLIPAIQSCTVQRGTRPSFELRAPAAKKLPASRLLGGDWFSPAFLPHYLLVCFFRWVLSHRFLAICLSVNRTALPPATS